MPTAPKPITSPPPVPGQPYDATDDGALGRWVSVNPESGAAGPDGKATGDFPDDGAAIWKQT